MDVERWQRIKALELEIIEDALTLIMWDREHTEGIVGGYMDGNNWANWGNFVAVVEEYVRQITDDG